MTCVYIRTCLWIVQNLMEGKDIVSDYSEAIEETNNLVSEEGMWAFPNMVSSNAATEASEALEPTFGPYIRWDYYAELGYPEDGRYE